MKNPDPKISVYYLTKRQRIFYGLLFIVSTVSLSYFLYAGIASLMGISIEGTHFLCIYPVVIFGILYYALLCFHLTFRTRLIISSEGIQYKYFGAYINAKWDEVEKIYPQEWLFLKYESIYVRPSAFKAKGLLASIYWTEIIPVALFAYDWQNNTLGEEIKRYKPDLFSQR